MGIGFGSIDALTLLPLSSTHALAMFAQSRSNDVGAVDGRRVRGLNIEVTKRSQRFVMGRDDALITSVARAAKRAETRWQSKLSMTPRLSGAARKAANSA